ncbi:MAG: hypothetical protein CL862_08400 [Cyanobium sp. NAT70]|nr:hypothetical protein [Cyanobium sp. NAT70]|tara:strand:+ start:145 stop:1200 length:1056 start_codon:yes stop_codon:yes gene_type:complete
MIVILAFAFNLVLKIFLAKNNLHQLFFASVLLQPVSLSLVAGFFLRQQFRFCRDAWIRQSEYLSSRFLSLALILLGAKFVAADLKLISPKTIAFLVFSILFTCFLSTLYSKFLGIRHNMMLWLIAGNCICGPTAISFAAQIFQGEKKDIAKAIWINTMIGFLLMLLMPVLGLAFDLDPNTFGVWAGASLQSTAQVVTSAAMYSSESSELALLIKSIRILFLVPLISFLLIFFRHDSLMSKSCQSTKSNQLGLFDFVKMLPRFMIGFAIVAVSFFLIDLVVFHYALNSEWLMRVMSLRQWLGDISSFCLAMAMFGIGFLCNFKFQRSDFRIIVFALCSALQLLLFSYIVALI